MEEHSFLGNGWSFEVMPDPVTGKIRMCGGEDDIAQAVRLILNTRRGERVMRPDFGCRLCDFAFEAFSQSVRSEMIDEIKTALTLHEPRIRDVEVAIDDTAPEGRIVLDIRYVVRATNSPYNLVFPFYAEDGGVGSEQTTEQHGASEYRFAQITLPAGKSGAGVPNAFGEAPHTGSEYAGMQYTGADVKEADNKKAAETGAPEIDRRGFADIMEEIARLAKEYAPDWKFSPDAPDAGTALACVFARRTAETVEKLNRTPLNHRRRFYGMLGAETLPALPASGCVQFELSGINKDCFPIGEGFGLFSPVINEQGARLSFETTRNVWLAPTRIAETVYADPDRDLLCFRDETAKVFEPSVQSSSNERYLRFGHRLLESLTENCRLYMTVSGIDGERWAERLGDPRLARFVQIADGKETEIGCFNEKGRMRIAASGCGSVKAEIKSISEFEGLLFGGVNITFEGWKIKPDNVFVNGETENGDAFYAFGEAPAAYDAFYIESAAAFSKSGAVVTLGFDLDFDVVVSGELPEPVIPNKLFVKKSEVRVPERKKTAVDETVWEYWNGTGFAPLRELERYANIFSGVGSDGEAVQRTRYELKFVCPDDISPVLVGAGMRLCVRARVRRVKNAFAVPSEIYLPVIENPRISYKYEKPITVSDIEIVNNREKRSLSRSYPFTRLPSTALYIGLDAPVRGFTLLACRGNPTNQLDSAEWSVLTDRGWESVIPETEVGYTGFYVFDLRVPPTKSALFGRTAYWLKAGLPRDTQLVPDELLLNCAPVVQREDIECFCSDSTVESIDLDRKNILDLRVCVNTAKKNEEENWTPLHSGWTLNRAEGIIRFSPALNLIGNSRTVKLNYRCGGGSAGNLPAGCEFVPALTDGSIRGASNPFPFIGGSDSESMSHMEARMAGQIRHRNRPITKKDLEELLIGDDIVSLNVTANRGGGVDVKAVLPIGASAEDIQNTLRAKLRDIMPAGAGAPQITVTYENG